MAASLSPPATRFFRTYGAAGGWEPRRGPGRSVARWFSPKDRKRFWFSSSSSDASAPSPCAASDDSDDPDFRARPVRKRRKGTASRVATDRPREVVTRACGRQSHITTPRRLRLRARRPQKCSTPCKPLRLPPFPPSKRGRLSPVLSGCGQTEDGGELGTSASLFSPPAAPAPGSPGSADAASELASHLHLPAATPDLTPRPCAQEAATGARRLTRLTSRRSDLVPLAGSGKPEDSETGAGGKKARRPCRERKLSGTLLVSPGLPSICGSSRTTHQGSGLEIAPQGTDQRDCENRGYAGWAALGETHSAERTETAWKRKHQEVGETSHLRYHRHERGKKMEKESSLTQYLPHLQNSCSWTKTRASFSLHKKKIINTLSEVCTSNTIASSLSGSFISEYSSSVTNRTTSVLSPWHSSSMHLLSPLKTVHLADKKTSDAEKVYGECNQEGPVPFSYCFSTEILKSCEKIGEGVFGEVFQITDNHTPVALKVIAIEGLDLVNGAHQKTFEEILPEIIISKELSLLSDEVCNRTEGFIGLHSVHCVQGTYPPLLLKAWDDYKSTKGSENDRPDFFKEDQLFIVLKFELGGTDLEQMRKKLQSLATAKSILHQITASLAVAEASLRFEHRDLHWGNVLLKKTKLKELHYTLNGETNTIPTHGIQVNIIDYTLSRLERDGIVIFCDVSKDEGLFTGEDDYQFEIYRLMRKKNNNCWGEYHPYSNVLWLHYLTDKILKEMTFKTKANTHVLKQLRQKIRNFHNTVLNFSSATDLLCQHSLFK